MSATSTRVARVVVLAVAIAILSIALGAVTIATVQAQTLEQQVQTDMQQRFDEADIEGVELVSVTVDYEPADIILGNGPQVNVLVGVPRDIDVPADLAQRWDDELTESLGRDVRVRVGFLEAQFSEGEESNPPFGWASLAGASQGRVGLATHPTACPTREPRPRRPPPRAGARRDTGRLLTAA